MDLVMVGTHGYGSMRLLFLGSVAMKVLHHQQELVKWIRPIARKLKGIFLVHGEPTPQTVLAAVLKDQFDIPVICPTRGQSFQLTPAGPAA